MLSDRDVHVERAAFTSNPARRQPSARLLACRCLPLPAWLVGLGRDWMEMDPWMEAHGARERNPN